jgi:hypothetical protein
MEADLADVSFDGAYFDARAHWEQNVVASRYGRLMDRYDVGAAVLFSPSQSAAANYRSFLEDLTSPGGAYLPFMSDPPPANRLNAQGFSDLYERSGPAFYGIGAFDRPADPPGFTQAPLGSLFELAGRLDLPVAYRPAPEQADSIENGLRAYSDTTFVFHGAELLSMGRSTGDGHGTLLPRLLADYDNCYVTADVPTLLDGKPGEFARAGAFVDWYDSSKSRPPIQRARTTLRSLLDTAPSKVLWGTGLRANWQVDGLVLSRYLDATERILDAVPTSQRDPYRYGNALALFDL